MKARMAFKVLTVLTAGTVIFTATRVVNAGEVSSYTTAAAVTQMQQEETLKSVEVESTTIIETEVETEVETTVKVTVEATETEAEFEEETEAEAEDDFSNDELELLAHLIYAEAGDQSDDCQRATGNVVLNRMAHRYYPNTMYGVIYQKGQYACTWGDCSINRTPSERAYANARWLLSGNRYFGSSDYVYQAQFEQGYHTVWIGTECFGTYSK